MDKRQEVLDEALALLEQLDIEQKVHLAAWLDLVHFGDLEPALRRMPLYERERTDRGIIGDVDPGLFDVIDVMRTNWIGWEA